MSRVALVTGGARGIGRATVRALAADGWSVAFSYRTAEDEARQLHDELRSLDAPVLTTRCDASSHEACAELVERVVSDLGPIHALVNCIGAYRSVPLLEETVAGWHGMLDHNLHPVFYLCRLVVRPMIEAGGGRIINFSIAHADRAAGQTRITAHYAAKVGVLVLTRSFAKEVARHAITVNAISPGFLDSGGMPADELEQLAVSIPAGHVGTPSDAVGAVRFLLSDAASYVNGAHLQVSGGWGT
ncbi:MAG: 3-oxoacyl-ACP reductase [Planctomycetes bacterium]|jgi:3-oxoacyl-[acyl-carrier protein] reductase|nr:3-oxoacyl-ACP reductase [Planctomycetota bacterium]MDP6424099.1 SDR family oxidoreductase [Planctomycetota bacterium]